VYVISEVPAEIPLISPLPFTVALAVTDDAHGFDDAGGRSAVNWSVASTQTSAGRDTPLGKLILG
jgi:hypothetical protein